MVRLRKSRVQEIFVTLTFAILSCTRQHESRLSCQETIFHFVRKIFAFFLIFLKDQQRASIDPLTDAILISTRISIIDHCVRRDKEANSMFPSIRYYLRTVLNALFLIILETIAAQCRDFLPFFKSTKLLGM